MEEKKRPYYGGGRKATGRKRNMTLSLNFTEDELNAVNEKLKSINAKNKTNALLKLLKII